MSSWALAVATAISFAIFVAPQSGIHEDLAGFPIVPTQSILWVMPAHGEENVSFDRPIVIAISEPMNSSSIIWSITPLVSEYDDSWSNDGSILTVSHAPFRPSTQYMVLLVFPGGDPGDVPNPWSFRTAALLLPAENLDIKRV